MPPTLGGAIMTRKVTVSWEEVFERLPKEEQVAIPRESEKLSVKYDAIIKFREVKELARKRIESSENLSPDAIREIEKHTDFLLSLFRQAIEAEGGKFKVEMEIPDLMPYNLFDLRDEYEDLEGTPLGPFYEEEDINEANRLAEQRAMEKLESEMDEQRKVAA